MRASEVLKRKARIAEARLAGEVAANHAMDLGIAESDTEPMIDGFDYCQREGLVYDRSLSEACYCAYVAGHRNQFAWMRSTAPVQS